MRLRPASWLILLWGCAGTPTGVPLEQEFELAIDQRVPLDTTGATLRFVAVPEDSRCPSDVVCVWAGNARVLLRVHREDGEHTVTLNTTTEPRRATVAGFEIQLNDLSPLPRAGAPISPAQYRAKLEVRRAPG